MGIRKVFERKNKEPTEEEIRNDLNNVGISTKSGNTRQEKFGAFKSYAQTRQSEKPGLAPVNPYANVNASGNLSPYGNSSLGVSQGNPYGASNDNPYGSSGQTNGTSSQSDNNPYNSRLQSSPYGSQSQGQARRQQNDPYSNPRNNTEPVKRGSNPYSVQSTRYSERNSQPSARQTMPSSGARRRDDDEESTLDLNAIPSHQMYASTSKPARRMRDEDDLDLDLNDVPEDDDLNLELDELPEEEQVNSEDEEVEAIRQDIRFVKQESVALTRNTLRMAQEADASGTNTLGVLGSQSERLYNTEQNLLLADTQTKVAEEKVNELKRLNRSIFVPAYGNPFNRKSRLREKEERIKADKTQQKYLRETNRKEMYASEQRIKQGITQNATNSDIHQKYQGEQALKAAQRYQFENDSEDDEMEKELAANLDQIGLYAKKLKSTANTMGMEVDSQNQRLRKIEDDADRLDIDVHMNSARLNSIR